MELLGALTHLVSTIVYLHQSSPEMLWISASAAMLTLPIMYVAESVSDLLRRKAEQLVERGTGWFVALSYPRAQG